MTFVRMRNRRQITLPQDLCGALDLKEHDYLEVTLDEDRIVLKPSARYTRPPGRREEIMATPIQWRKKADRWKARRSSQKRNQKSGGRGT